MFNFAPHLIDPSGALTIVRRSSSRKNINQFENITANTADNRLLNFNAEITAAAGTSQTTSTERVVQLEGEDTSEVSSCGYKLPRTNQAQATAASSLISEEGTRSVSDNRVLFDKSVLMTSSPVNFDIDIDLPAVDAPDACDKAAFR